MTPAIDRSRPVHITRAGQFYDPRYGDFTISRAMLRQMVDNFERGAFGQAVFVDLHHQPELGAAGELKRLWLDGDDLLGEVQWTPFGRIAIEEKGFAYLSPEYDERFVDNESGQAYGAVLKGIGLTTRPVIKRLEKVSLSDFSRFRARLLEVNPLPEVANALSSLWIHVMEATCPMRVSDQARLEQHLVALAEGLPHDPPRYTLEDLDKKIRLHEARLAAQREARRIRFQGMRDAYLKTIRDYPGPAEERGALIAMAAQIQPDWTDAQVMSLAEHALKLADEISIDRQLTALGWHGPRPARRGWP